MGKEKSRGKKGMVEKEREKERGKRGIREDMQLGREQERRDKRESREEEE